MDAEAVDPLEIRRIFLKDSEWERTSESWKALKPLRDFNQLRELPYRAGGFSGLPRKWWSRA